MITAGKAYLKALHGKFNDFQNRIRIKKKNKNVLPKFEKIKPNKKNL